MKRDEKGYFYFVDRIGDTFRWKGENVSTNEVAEAISVFSGIQEANVYGVAIPGKDGRAGMAAIIASDNLDFSGLATHLTKQLPSYAVPLFIRKLQRTMEVTGTFKHRSTFSFYSFSLLFFLFFFFFFFHLPLFFSFFLFFFFSFSFFDNLEHPSLYRG